MGPVLVDALAIGINEVESISADVVPFVDDGDSVASFSQLTGKNSTSKAGAYDEDFHLNAGSLRISK
jgi:hypothetical protein